MRLARGLVRLAVSIAALATTTLALDTRTATADEPPVACAAWDVEYLLAAKLELTDTPMGEGDGVYTIGPGKVVLRFDDRNGQPGGTVNMISYAMREYFVITSKTLFWTTTVTTDTNTSVTPNACSSAAEGTLVNQAVRWTSPVRGYRTDGNLTCKGSLCGSFGAPPAGRSELHIGPGPVTFNPFVLARDMKTFTMAPALVSKTSMPKQTGFVALGGRETKRACAPAKPCAEGR